MPEVLDRLYALENQVLTCNVMLTRLNWYLTMAFWVLKGLGATLVGFGIGWLL